jgi:hypothetical protein
MPSPEEESCALDSRAVAGARLPRKEVLQFALTTIPSSRFARFVREEGLEQVRYVSNLQLHL